MQSLRRVSDSKRAELGWNLGEFMIACAFWSFVSARDTAA